jgi:NAD(P)-dependent dehydrogenase (short-subunit alcohol dehydrogenase family)
MMLSQSALQPIARRRELKMTKRDWNSAVPSPLSFMLTSLHLIRAFKEKTLELTWQRLANGSASSANGQEGETKAGRVLNIPGISGTMLLPGALSTTLPNAAIIGFSELMANDLTPFNILVNNLCPGTIDVESWGPRAERMAKARGTTVDQVRNAFAGMSMLNRLGRPEEMGWIAAFLVSEKNSYMTGTTIESCGGATKYL